MITVVELIDSRPPRKRLSIIVHPKALPATIPTVNIPMQMVTAVMSALLPTLSSFLKLNSSPRAKRRKMMPISDHWLTDSVLEMTLMSPRCGLTMKPAMI